MDISETLHEVSLYAFGDLGDTQSELWYLLYLDLQELRSRYEQQGLALTISVGYWPSERRGRTLT